MLGKVWTHHHGYNGKDVADAGEESPQGAEGTRDLLPCIHQLLVSSPCLLVLGDLLSHWLSRKKRRRNGMGGGREVRRGKWEEREEKV